MSARSLAGTTDDETDDPSETCAALGHDDDCVYEGDDGRDYRCLRCGAEWWEEPDDASAEGRP